MWLSFLLIIPMIIPVIVLLVWAARQGITERTDMALTPTVNLKK